MTVQQDRREAVARLQAEWPRGQIIEHADDDGFMPIAVTKGCLVYLQQGNSMMVMSHAVAAQLARALASKERQ